MIAHALDELHHVTREHDRSAPAREVFEHRSDGISDETFLVVRRDDDGDRTEAYRIASSRMRQEEPRWRFTTSVVHDDVVLHGVVVVAGIFAGIA